METSKNLSFNDLPATPPRPDKGGRHKASIWGDCKIRCYRLNGEFVAEFANIRDAVEKLNSPEHPLTYANIWSCLMGRQKKTGGYLWKSNIGRGRGYLNMED